MKLIEDRPTSETTVFARVAAYRANDSRYLKILGTLLFFQVLLVSISFPLSSLWSATPLFYSDGGIHWYRMKTAVNLAAQGKLIGYDPFFNAGTYGGITHNPAAKLPTLAAVVLNPWLSEMQVWKLYSFACAIFGPICVSLALYWCGVNEKGLLIGSVLGMMLWWASVFRWYHTNGLVSFVFVAFLSLPYLIKTLDYFQGRGGWRVPITLGGVGALGMFIHPLFPLPISLGTLIYLVISRRRLHWHRVLSLLIVTPCLSLLPNLFWLYPLFFRKFAPELWLGNYQQVVDINLLWKEMTGIWVDNVHGSKIYGPLVLGTFWMFLKGRSILDRSTTYTLTFLGFILLLFAYLGGATIAREIEPNRLAPVGYLFLIIPATIGILATLKSAADKRSPRSRLGARVSIGLLGIAGIYNANEVRREVSYADVGHYGLRPPETRDLGERSRWVLDWLGRNTTESARVLFETSKGRIYDGSRMAGYFAFTSNREFIGGPYPFLYFAGFWDGYLFNRAIGEISPEEFKKYIDLYNIGWIIVHSKESQEYIERQPGVVFVDQFKELKTYKIVRVPSYFLKGDGRIQDRSHNRILLRDLSGDSVIIKYHYLRGLETKPAASIVPVQIMDDPNPFIEVINPPRELLLQLR